MKTENLWRCPVCGHVMTEEQSKGYRGCPTGMHLAKHQSCEEIDCPDCYGGHFRPCQTCGDTGHVINIPNSVAAMPNIVSGGESAKTKCQTSGK